MTVPAGTVNSSQSEPSCADPNCDQSVVPGGSLCGVHTIEGSPQADGTISPQGDQLSGYSDGTGRSATPTQEDNTAVNIEDIEASVRAVDDGDESAAPLRRALIALATEHNAQHVLPTTWQPDGTVVLEDESRDAPTDSDAAVESGLSDAKDAISSVKEEQLKDPDNDSDPDDKDVLDAINDAEDAIDAAITAQSKDSDEDREDEHPRAQKRRKPRHRSTPVPHAELRLRVTDLQLRSGGAGSNEIVLEGTPIVYNSAYTVYDMFGEFKETMAPTVCDAVLASPLRLDCRYLFNHDGLPLARTQSGTLELNNGPTGLKSVAHLDGRQQLANDLAVAVERGDVSQMSCGFIVASDAWNDDYTERTIYSFEELLDVSPVTYPASPTTSVSLAQRALYALPEQTRARVREAFKVANEVRAGKVLSAQNAQLIMSALESLHQADDLDPEDVASRAAVIAEAHQAARSSLEQVSGLALDPAGNTDGDAVTENDPGEGIREDTDPDKEARDAELAAEEAAELRRKAIKAQRDRLARKRHYG